MSGERADSILRAICRHKPYFIALLRNLVEAESPSSRQDSHRRTRRIFMSALQQVGYTTSETGHAGVPQHIFAMPSERKRHEPIQLVVGHYDTVWPIGTINKRPFVVEGNRIRGPGVFDMKAGLAQLILALRALKELDLEPSLTPVVFINADEEIGSRTSTRYIERLAACSKRAFILEPSMGEHGALKTERKGVGRYTITTYGKAAHAGLDPESGASAILELSHVIQSLFAMNDASRGISINVGTIDGGVRPNVIAPHSTAVVDVRVPTIVDGEMVNRKICALEPETPGVRLRIEGQIGRPAMESTAENQLLWEYARDVGRELGLELTQARVGGASDGNTTSQYTSTLDGLGAVGDGAHATREFIYIDKTLERAALLAMLLLAPRQLNHTRDS